MKPNRRPTLRRVMKGKLLEEQRGRSLNDVGVEVVGDDIDVTSKVSLLDEESDMSLENYEKHLGPAGVSCRYAMGPESQTSNHCVRGEN